MIRRCSACGQMKEMPLGLFNPWGLCPGCRDSGVSEPPALECQRCQALVVERGEPIPLTCAACGVRLPIIHADDSLPGTWPRCGSGDLITQNPRRITCKRCRRILTKEPS